MECYLQQFTNEEFVETLFCSWFQLGHRELLISLVLDEITRAFQTKNGLPYKNSKVKLISWSRFHNDIEMGNLGNSTGVFYTSRSRSSPNRTVAQRKIFDPEDRTVRTWSKAFLVTCLVSLFVDPLFFFLPSVRGDFMCIETDDLKLKLFLTVMRSVADVFYAVQIYVRFHTAYSVPLSSTSVFGKGILVVDPLKIAVNYLKNGFFIDLFVGLPLPQVMIWGVVQNLSESKTRMKFVFLLIMICQYLPRLYLIFPLSSQIVKSADVATQTSWSGAAYNLMLSILASHVIGACWFLQAIARQERCWQHACNLETRTCQYRFFDCSIVDDAARKNWYKSSNVTNVCYPDKSDYAFGIYGEALTSKVTSSPFFNRYFYSLWWGLKNLSSLGQGLMTSTSIGEIIFAIIIAILGLVLFALLISNMQKYLQSTTIRLEEWRTRRSDTEQWMHHRQLPQELRESVRRYERYRWVSARGVDEDALLNSLPHDLHKKIKRHLCLHIIRQVPLFADMDEVTQDLILERLKLTLYTEGTLVIKERHPLSEMIFIIRGQLSSFITVAADQPRIFDSCLIGPGDFYGHELLTWSFDPRPRAVLPSSPRTVQAISEVEAFAITAEDLRDVGVHVRVDTRYFRYYSLQCRTWAACLIQKAWRGHKRRINAC